MVRKNINLHANKKRPLSHNTTTTDVPKESTDKLIMN